MSSEESSPHVETGDGKNKKDIAKPKKQKEKDKKHEKKTEKKNKTKKKKRKDDNEDDLEPLVRKDQDDDDDENDEMGSEEELSGLEGLLDLKEGKVSKKPATSTKKQPMKKRSKKRSMGDEETPGMYDCV